MKRGGSHACARAAAAIIGVAIGGAGLAQPVWRAGPPETTGARAPAPGEVVRTAGAALAAPRRVTIRLDRPPTARERAALERGGVRLLQPLGGGTWTATIEPGADGARAAIAGARVIAASPIDPVRKIHPALHGGRAPAWAVTSADPRRAGPGVLLQVMFHADARDDEILDALMRHGCAPRASSRSARTTIVDAPLDAARALAAEDVVLWVEPASPPLEEANNDVRARIGADIAAAPPYGLTGAGVRVMVFDSGTADPAHPDFVGRLEIRDNSGPRPHSTHVTGTLAGSGAFSGGLYRGVAPAVMIESYGLETGSSSTDPQGEPLFLYTDPGDFEADYYEAFLVNGADLASNSLSTNVAPNGFDCVLEGDYGVWGVIADAVARGSLGRNIPIFFAAGNERSLPNCGATFSTTPPSSSAKNLIAVGAAYSDTDNVAIFSSYGPTDDGRLRPDIVGPGCQISEEGGVTSTRLNGGYEVRCGTSMATPAVAGVAALLIEDFRAHFPGLPDPSNALHKAFLVQGAVDIGAPGPDFTSGYGSVRAPATIDALRTGGFVEAEVAHGGAFRALVDVAPGRPELRITLAWDDVPGAPNVLPALVNDLDLVVRDPQGIQHAVWTLDPSNPAAPAVRTVPDRLNPLEQVLVSNPAPGQWTVEVVGFDVPGGPQRFALVAGAGLRATVIEPVETPPAELAAGTAREIAVRVRHVGEGLAGAPMLRYRTASFAPQQSLMMQDQGGGVWAASLPAMGCNAMPEWRIDAVTTLTGTASWPPGTGQVHEALILDRTIVFADDFESFTGWTPGDPGDTATAGVWERINPRGSRAQAEHDHTEAGDRCYATGQNPADASPSNGDLDGGFTTLTSPPIDLPAGQDATVTFWRWLSTVTGGNPNEPGDVLTLEVSADEGPWTLVEQVGPGGVDGVGGWREMSFRLEDHIALPATVRLRWRAFDEGGESVVEAAIDDVVVSTAGCALPPCPADRDGDLLVTFADLNYVLAGFNSSGNNLPGDADGDGDVDFADLNIVVGAFNTDCP